MLIEEKAGKKVSAITQNNRKEVYEATSVIECNSLLEEGWGLLTAVPGCFYNEVLGRRDGIIYVMARTRQNGSSNNK